jgi:hypothetical protein
MLSLVFGLSWTDLNSAQAPAMPLSGNSLKKIGTAPRVCSISRKVAWLLASCAHYGRAKPENRPRLAAIVAVKMMVAILPAVLRMSSSCLRRRS